MRNNDNKLHNSTVEKFWSLVGAENDSSLCLCSFVGIGVVNTSLYFVVDDFLGSSESIIQLASEGVEALATDGLFLATSLGVSVLKSSLASNSSCNGGLSFKSALGLGVWVKSLHKSLVLQWVLVGGLAGNGGSSDAAELALDLVRVDDSGEVGAGH